MNPFTYTFILGPDETRMRTYPQYLEDNQLRRLVNDPDIFKLFLGLTIVLATHDMLRANKNFAKLCSDLETTQQVNPLQFYAPNSQEQLDFINDDEYDLAALVDLNRVGKSTAAYIKALVNVPTIQCDSDWPIFAEHGVKYKEFRGPVSGAIATYNQAKIEDPIWKEIVRKWTPDKELGIYGRTFRGRGGKYAPAWGHDRLILLAVSRSTIAWYTYEMDFSNYEGAALKWWLWDEQGREAMFDGADRGTRTTKGRHFCSLTPHRIKGRPDTGAAGWMYPLLTGLVTKGHKVKTWTSGDISDAPDWIYPETEKEKEREKWEHEPLRMDNQKVLAEGRARLHGEWHRTGGLVFDEWSPKHHWIEPLWDYPPKGLTLYRSIDHGQTEPTVCLGWAVDHQDIYIYREYYSRGQQIYKDVENIIKLWGNHRKKLGNYKDISGMIMPRFEEVFDREGVARTALDSRTASSTDGNMKTYGWLYQQAGLRRLAKASGKHYEDWVPFVNILLANAKAEKVDPGTPRLFIFNTCVNLKREIETWSYEEASDGKEEKPADANNHGPTTIGYGVQIPLRYHGDMFSGLKELPPPDPKDYWADPLQRRNRRREPGRTLGYRRM